MSNPTLPVFVQQLKLTEPQEWHVVNGVNPLHNSGARVAVYQACRRKGLVDGNGRRTELGNRVRAALVESYADV